jgi:hypothetical protein
VSGVAKKSKTDTEHMFRVKQLGSLLLSGHSPETLVQDKAKEWLIPVKEAQSLVNDALQILIKTHARTRSHALVNALNFREKLLDRLLPPDIEAIDPLTARTALAIANSHSKLLRLFDDEAAFNEMLATIEPEVRLSKQPYQLTLDLMQGLSYSAVKELGKQVKSKDTNISRPAAIALVKAGQQANLQLELLDRLKVLEREEIT